MLIESTLDEILAEYTTELKTLNLPDSTIEVLREEMTLHYVTLKSMYDPAIEKHPDETDAQFIERVKERYNITEKTPNIERAE